MYDEIVDIHSLDDYQLIITGNDHVSGRAMVTPWFRWVNTYVRLIDTVVRVYAAVQGRRFGFIGTAEEGMMRVSEADGTVVLHVDWTAEMVRTQADCR